MKPLFICVLFLVVGPMVSTANVDEVPRYVVTWEVWSLVPVPCPDKGKLDEYTGKWSSPWITCSVFHASWKVDRNMKKDFNEREKAIKFVENAPSDDTWVELKNFKLIQISGVDTIITKMPREQ